MTVFKTYLKILNKNKFLIILYTVILIFFAIFNMKNQNTTSQFVAEKPDILIVYEEEPVGIVNHFISYIEKNSTLKEIKNTEEARDDALFYRDVNYIIYIPKDFRTQFLEGKKINLKIKSTGDYQASFAQMMVNRYLDIANLYRNIGLEEEKLIELIDRTLKKEVLVEVTSRLDRDQFSKSVLFYNFANYSILAGCIFIICFMISSFQEKKIKDRTLVSSMESKKWHRILLFANGLFAFTLWLFYVLLSLFLIGNVMISAHGLLLILNFFIFTISAVSLAFLIGNLVHHKEAISGIVNVIALGSSFLCGAFVPSQFLPDFVLKIAHILPSYYYIANNERIGSLESIQFETLKPIILYFGMMLLFSLLFIIIVNITTKKNQR